MSAATDHLTTSDDGALAATARDRLHGDPLRGRRARSAGVRAAVPGSALSDDDQHQTDLVRETPPLGLDVREDGDATPALPADRTADVPVGTSATHAPARLSRRSPRVSVVIPTYNEARNLPHVLPRLPADLHEVILVDGRSVDDTVEVARALRSDVKIVMQNRIGKGNAMACGFAAVTGDIVVMLDADGSADPEEISRFVAALVGGADFAKGSRFTAGGGSSDITAVRAWGNRWLNRTANVLFGTRYTDLCYGYNAFWRHCLDSLELDPRAGDRGGKQWGDGFEIENIINTRIAKARLVIAEVPS